MSGFMLDSNVLIDIARDPAGAVAQAFQSRSHGEISISPIVSGEIRFGMKEHSDARSNPSMAFLLRALRVDPLEPPVDEIYGSVRSKLRRRGKALSPNDYWIAAQAIMRDAVLVTGDLAFHDAGLEGLKVEDWRVVGR